MKNIRDISKPYAIYAGNTPLGLTEVRVLQGQPRGKRWFVAIKSEAKGLTWDYEHMYSKDIVSLDGLELEYISEAWDYATHKSE